MEVKTIKLAFWEYPKANTKLERLFILYCSKYLQKALIYLFSATLSDEMVGAGK